MTLDDRAAEPRHWTDLVLALMGEPAQVRGSCWVYPSGRYACVVHMIGPARGTWWCHHGRTGGEAVALIRYARGVDGREARTWLAGWLTRRALASAQAHVRRLPRATARPPATVH